MSIGALNAATFIQLQTTWSLEEVSQKTETLSRIYGTDTAHYGAGDRGCLWRRALKSA